MRQSMGVALDGVCEYNYLIGICGFGFGMVRAMITTEGVNVGLANHSPTTPTTSHHLQTTSKQQSAISSVALISSVPTYLIR
jgi:hypothetical protein